MKYQERIRALRQDNDLSQREIADMLGIAQTTYSQYELDKRPMPIEYLVALCKFYKVSADYMLGLSEKKIIQFMLVLHELDYFSFLKQILISVFLPSEYGTDFSVLLYRLFALPVFPHVFVCFFF